MSSFFVDTSALAKRYVNEPGSRWVLSWITPEAGNIIFIAELTLVEMRHTFTRQARDNLIAVHDAITLYGNFSAHLSKEYIPVLIDTALLKTASNLVHKHSQHKLRSLDGIQLASAILAERDFGEKLVFISGDNNLLAAASAEGFTIDNPYQHP